MSYMSNMWYNFIYYNEWNIEDCIYYFNYREFGGYIKFVCKERRMMYKI